MHRAAIFAPCTDGKNFYYFLFGGCSLERVKLYLIVFLVVSGRQLINSEAGSMSKRWAAEFSVADLRVHHKVNVQRLFDQFVAINVENLRGTMRTLESWLVAKYGLQVTYECMSFFAVFFTLALFCAKTSLRQVQANHRGGF